MYTSNAQMCFFKNITSFQKKIIYIHYMKKILAIADSSNIRKMLSLNLKNEGYNVSVNCSVEKAFKKLTPDCDLIIMDAKIGSDYECSLVEKCHKESGIPMIFLPELKPFVSENLSDHVKMALKILKPGCFARKFIKIGCLHIDPCLKIVKIGDSVIPLTKMEYEIFYMFASNPLKPYTRQQITNAVLGASSKSVTSHSADAHIVRLRKKLGAESRCISNRRGYGYLFDPHVLLEMQQH
jgi:DNA-binding response OmpR family regulator